MFICIIFATAGIFCKLIITKYIVESILVFQWGKRKARTRFALKGSFWICHFFLIKFVTSFSQILKQKKEPVISFLVSLWLSPWEFLAFFFLSFFFLRGTFCNFSVKNKQTNHFSFFFFLFFLNVRICYFFLANLSFFVNLFLVWYMNNWIPDKSQVIPSGYS